VLSEDVLSEDVLSEDVLSEDVLSEDVLSEDVLSEDVLSEEVLSEEVLSEEGVIFLEIESTSFILCFFFLLVGVTVLVSGSQIPRYFWKLLGFFVIGSRLQVLE
jgi:hypothetical protein